MDPETGGRSLTLLIRQALLCAYWTCFKDRDKVNFIKYAKIRFHSNSSNKCEIKSYFRNERNPKHSKITETMKNR